MDDLHSKLKTHLDYFYKWEEETPDRTFLRQPFGDQWTTLSYREAGDAARRMAMALRGMGLQPGDHVAIISKNCYHWILADLAISMGGFVSTPFYPNLSTKQVAEVIEKSDAKLAFVGKLDEWNALDAGIPDDMPLIRFPHYPGNAEVSRGKDWDELIASYEPLSGQTHPDLAETWTVLFTSGTTGSPKGVVHTYENVAKLVRSEEQHNNLKTFTMKDPSFFSFLPLNHIAERTAVELCALLAGGTISFAESIDTFAKNLQDTQPTLFFAVPRIWTKFYMGVTAKMPPKRLDTLLKIPIISGIIRKKIQKALGLSRVEMVMTGASITPEALKQWYRRLGINLREVYGMTENMGGFSIMPEFEHKPNTVGKPMKGCEGRIHPDTGEILMKVPWTMTGYYKEPELSAQVLVDEWLHTGDKGEMDEEGYIRIIGRVKDAFKTSKGKFVVPTLLEDHFSGSDHIEQICVAGLGIPQPIALVNLSEAGQQEPREKITRMMQAQLDAANTHLHGHERISTLIIAREIWSPDNQLLTPTLKIRRGAIDERYMPQYPSWHEDNRAVIWEDD